MTKIIKDNGQWEKAPSGAKNGNLEAWRDRMYSLCPEPEVGTIVVTFENGKISVVGYRCIQPAGYDSVWERVKNTGDLEIQSNGYVDGVLVQITPSNKRFITETSSGIPCTSEGVYLGDGVYIDPDECWF